MTDVLIISPSSKSNYQDLSDDFSAREANIWAGLLANSVRSIGRGVEILDLQIESLDETELWKRVQSINPSFVLIVATGANPNASTSEMAGAIWCADTLKHYLPDKKVGVVGPHVNALPMETLKNHNCVDFVLTNEGVYALQNLVRGGIDFIDDVNGVAYRDEVGVIRINPPERIVPQDRLECDLPGVAYDLMPDLAKYRTSHWHSLYNNNRSPFASIYTSLGCSFACGFCMINIINRTKNGEDKYAGMFNKFRYWSPEFTIKQLDYLAERGVKHIKIADELFLNAPKKHAMPLCELIIERGYDFNIWCYSRTSTAKPQYLDRLREAGVSYLALGIESVSQNVRQEIEKGRFEDVKIAEIVKMIEDAGINVINNMIVGLPGSTEESEEENFQFAQELSCSAYNVYPSMALPGSQLYVEAKARGAKLPQKYSEFGFLSYDCVPLANESLSSADILRIRDRNWQRYHSDPKFLKSIEDKFGADARGNIERMSKIKLKRKLLNEI